MEYVVFLIYEMDDGCYNWAMVPVGSLFSEEQYELEVRMKRHPIECDG